MQKRGFNCFFFFYLLSVRHPFCFATKVLFPAQRYFLPQESSSLMHSKERKEECFLPPPTPKVRKSVTGPNVPMSYLAKSVRFTTDLPSEISENFCVGSFEFSWANSSPSTYPPRERGGLVFKVAFSIWTPSLADSGSLSTGAKTNPRTHFSFPSPPRKKKKKEKLSLCTRKIRVKHSGGWGGKKK